MLEVSILQLFWSPKVPHSTPSLSLCLIFSSPSLSEPGVPPPLCPFPARASTVVKTLKLRVNCRFQNFEIPGQLPVGYSCLATAMPLIHPPLPFLLFEIPPTGDFIPHLRVNAFHPPSTLMISLYFAGRQTFLFGNVL